MRSSGGRLRYLDGMRGLAITAVMLWHFFGPAEANLLPYGAQYAQVPVLSAGWMGVELFFLISGFVIFLTLEKCSGFWDFMVRRWLRLFPAMLIATILLLGVDKLAGLPGPHGSARLIDIIPGLTFVHPSIWQAVLHTPVSSLNGSFWTLYVEMAFYVTFGALYASLGWRSAIFVLLALFLGLRGLEAIPFLHAGMVQRLTAPLHWCGVQYFGWFASGALFYKASQQSSRRFIVEAVGVGLISAALFRGAFGLTLIEHLQLAAVVGLFAAAQVSPAVQRILSWGPVVFMGAISYPLYLLHSNLGLPFIIRAAPVIAPLPSELGAVLAIATLIVLAWLVARFAEPWTKAQLRPITDRVRSFAGLVFA